MHRSSSARTPGFVGLLVAISAIALSPLAFAENSGLSPDQRVQELLPVYQRIHADPAMLARAEALDARDRATVDAFLRDWPISPLEMLKIDMFVRRYEIAIPRPVFELHQRWLFLHPEEGRRLYGDAAVDLARTGMALGEDSGPDASVVPDAPAVGTNRNVGATASPNSPVDYQGEIQVSVNPLDTKQLVASANTWDDIGGTCGDFGMLAVFYSSDGGITWGYTCVPSESAYGMTCSLSGGTFGSDPAVAWDDAGNVFIEYMMLCVNSSGTTYEYAVVVAKSTNGGQTWTNQGIVKNAWSTPNQVEDKNFYAIDVYSTSPFHGRHYTCWDRNNNEKFAYSTTGGASWTEVDLPAPAGFGVADLGCDIAVGDDGTVHVVFNRLACAAACTGERMYYTRSTNGGASWSTPAQVHAFNMYGFGSPAVNCPSAADDRCIAGFGSIDIDNSGGPCRGNLFVTYTDYPSGGNANGVDVWVRRSTDNGATWGAAVRVNDDASTSGNAQFNGFLTVDRGTRHVVVAFQDTRNDTSGDQEVDYYISRSSDCGATFETNLKLSAASGEFNNSAISYTNENSSQNANYNPNQFGEYLGLDVYGGRAYVSWTDSRHFFPGSTGNTQKENLGFAEARFDQVFIDGFETQDTRLWKVSP